MALLALSTLAIAVPDAFECIFEQHDAPPFAHFARSAVVQVAEVPPVVVVGEVCAVCARPANEKDATKRAEKMIFFMNNIV